MNYRSESAMLLDLCTHLSDSIAWLEPKHCLLGDVGVDENGHTWLQPPLVLIQPAGRVTTSHATCKHESEVMAAIELLVSSRTENTADAVEDCLDKSADVALAAANFSKSYILESHIMELGPTRKPVSGDGRPLPYQLRTITMRYRIVD